MPFSRGSLSTILIVWLSVLSRPVFCQQSSSQTDVKLLNELQTIRSSLQKIQGRLEKLESASQAYPRVTLTIRSPAGKPLKNFRVEMQSQKDQGRLVRATATSGSDGIAIDRILPHGQYRLKLEEPTGWSTFFTTVVEFGHPLKLTVVAPDPSHRGTVTLKSGLATEAFAGMRFGVKGRKYSRGSITYPAHEPNEAPGEMATYPGIDNGVRVVAVSATLGVNRKIEQPDGDVRNWQWYLSDQAKQSRFLFRSDKQMMRFEDTEIETVVPDTDSGFFADDFDQDHSDRQDNDDETFLQYLRLRNAGKPTRELKLHIPAGRLTVSSAKFLALATDEAVQSLNLDPAGEPVWLEADLRSDSVWPAHVLDLYDWTGYRSRSNPFRREVELETDGEQVIELRSAK